MNFPDFLRQLPYFAGLPEEELERICGDARRFRVPAGEMLIEEGATNDAMYVVTSGQFEVSQRSAERSVVLGTVEQGGVLGEMSLLDQAPAVASARALVDSRVAEIGRAAFQELLEDPAYVLAILHTVTDRLREAEAARRQDAKMAALGTMTAGLLHELNNPAAAVRRSAAQLVEIFQAWRDLGSRLGEADLAAGFAEPPGSAPADPLQRSDQEEALGTWLEEVGVEGPWELAPALVAKGWKPESLERLAEGLEPNRRAKVVRWLGLSCSIQLLLDEVGTAAARISELVGSVKGYAYLDQAPVQDVDVEAGLENTLVLLRHKMGTVEVNRDYDPDLPRIEAYGSELNQVWTNLIDNALDSMGEAGKLTLRTRSEKGMVVVEVIDDGPGIPPEIQGRIFDAFFTTKPQGQGTGIGLNTTYKMVTRHGGDIRVSSQPGETTFRVALPLRLPARREES
ncbi:MAG: sensor histidine kinase [Acidimicrobiia bacterium]